MIKFSRKGFTLIEFIIWLLVIAVLFLIALNLSRNTLATSLKGINKSSDREIFLAARKYIIDNEIPFKDNYVCVTTNDLIKYGYLVNETVDNRIIKVNRNKLTKVIERAYYVSKCN